MNANSPTEPEQGFVVGIDFGTLSGRAVVVRVSDGEELGSAVHEYSHGVIETSLPGSGVRLGPNWALQSPTDWIDVLRRAVPKALAVSGVDPADVIGIGTDFTACTVLPTLADGTPLCELDDLAARPHSWPKLWKHHAAQPHADLINEVARQRNEPWLGRYGGKISSEWEFAKGLQLLQEDPEIYARTERWIEAADWIIWQLSGTESRNVCTAGYKGIRTEHGYPSREYLTALDPAFGDFTDKLAKELLPLGASAGRLTEQAAEWTGLPAGIAVAAGNVDAHVTAAAADATRPGQLVAIMGTSTCHVMSSDHLAEVPGMCGVVDGGIIDGLWGYEAGQSAVGDIFGWFVDNCVPPAYVAEAERRGVSVHTYLEELAGQQPVGAHGLVALDWHNGNRSVLVDHDLSAVIVGQTLATRPEDTYRALIEATAFGTRRIVEAFEETGVAVEEFIVAGGLLKNRLLMQIYSDVLRRPISVVSSEQGPALGSAIHAAVAAGTYPEVPTAAASMGRRIESAYRPDPGRADSYDRLYAEYRQLHDWFAGEAYGGNGVLHRLHKLRNEVIG
ncbi:L-ribulokinase [Kribbella voronezhensis]|uniref:Ribulokinase n=1 Tax=Kribbella voronezhensis TaxID=2512212 RepID=A0A4R7T5Q7_9ACTN|nr:ribulokinase [Kribbella voronezhensis]TDU87200.1 L-ribulokinase [Kribbella voronezhensis]